MVCITWKKKQITIPWRQPRKKLQKENCDFQVNPSFRVKKECWAESQALHLSADSLSRPFIVLEIFILFCWLWYNRSHSLSPLGYFQYLNGRFEFFRVFYLLVFISLLYTFPFLSLTCSFWVALRSSSHA